MKYIIAGEEEKKEEVVEFKLVDDGESIDVKVSRGGERFYCLMGINKKTGRLVRYCDSGMPSHLTDERGRIIPNHDASLE